MRRYGHARYVDGELGWNKTMSWSMRCESRSKLRGNRTERTHGEEFPADRVRERIEAKSEKDSDLERKNEQLESKIAEAEGRRRAISYELDLAVRLEPAGIKSCELKRALYRPRQGRCGTAGSEASVRGLRPCYSYMGDPALRTTTWRTLRRLHRQSEK